MYENGFSSGLFNYPQDVLDFSFCISLRCKIFFGSYLVRRKGSEDFGKSNVVNKYCILGPVLPPINGASTKCWNLTVFIRIFFLITFLFLP